MSSYYCPFCSSRYKFQKTRTDGVLICGLCGDPLMKKSILNTKQIFGLLLASAFIAPLLAMFVFVIKDFTNEKKPSISQSLVLMSFM